MINSDSSPVQRIRQVNYGPLTTKFGMCIFTHQNHFIDVKTLQKKKYLKTLKNVITWQKIKKKRLQTSNKKRWT